jgi:hypothetical protein
LSDCLLLKIRNNFLILHIAQQLLSNGWPQYTPPNFALSFFPTAQYSDTGQDFCFPSSCPGAVDD